MSDETIKVKVTLILETHSIDFLKKMGVSKEEATQWGTELQVASDGVLDGFSIFTGEEDNPYFIFDTAHIEKAEILTD